MEKNSQVKEIESICVNESSLFMWEGIKEVLYNKVTFQWGDTVSVQGSQVPVQKMGRQEVPGAKTIRSKGAWGRHGDGKGWEMRSDRWPGYICFKVHWKARGSCSVQHGSHGRGMVLNCLAYEKLMH